MFAFSRTIVSWFNPNPTVALMTHAVPGERNGINTHDVGGPGAQPRPNPITCIRAPVSADHLNIIASASNDRRAPSPSHGTYNYSPGTLEPHIFIVNYSHIWQYTRTYGQILQFQSCHGLKFRHEMLSLFLQNHIQSFRGDTMYMHVLPGFEPCLLYMESTSRLGNSHDRAF